MSDKSPGCLPAVVAAVGRPRGCLLALVGLLRGRRGDGRSLAGERLPYRRRDDFLSAAELSFFRVLQLAVKESAVVCPKVNLADLFFVAADQQRAKHRNKIDRKHVDFVLCDPATMKPVAGIELDDASHQRADRQDRDALVNAVFESAGLPLIRFAARRGYRLEELAEQLQPILSGATDQAAEQVVNLVVRTYAPASTSAAPRCPKCAVAMVPRTVSKGDHQGRTFWGCTNYPRCRETAIRDQPSGGKM